MDRVCLKSKEAGVCTGGVCPEINHSIWARKLEPGAPCCLTEENYASIWQRNLWCHWDRKSRRNPLLTALINLPSYSTGSAYRTKTHRHTHTYVQSKGETCSARMYACTETHISPENGTSDAFFIACNPRWFIYVLCDFIIVLFNNHNNGFYFNELGRDLATETRSWMRTCGSGPGPPAGPLAPLHAGRRWEQRNKEVIKIN